MMFHRFHELIKVLYVEPFSTAAVSTLMTPYVPMKDGQLRVGCHGQEAWVATSRRDQPAMFGGHQRLPAELI